MGADLCKGEAVDQDPIVLISQRISKEAEVFTSTHQSWEDVLRSYNKDAQSQVPAVYVKCATENDVAECVKIAKEFVIPLTPRSGAHGLSGFSLVKEGIVVDVSKFKTISHSPQSETVTYQTGCKAGDVDQYLDENAPGWAWTSTANPQVGLGGRCSVGLGWLSRWLGTGVDNFVSAKVVLADGSIVTASKEEEPELFYALRGAGSNFGIVLEITQRIHNVLDPQRRPQVLYGVHFFPIDQAPQMYEEVLELSLRKDLPDQVYILPVLHYIEGELGMSITFVHYKYSAEKKEVVTEDHWSQEHMQKIISKYKGQAINQFGGPDGWGYITHLTLQLKTANFPWGQAFYTNGGYVTEANAKSVTSKLIAHWKESTIPECAKEVPVHISGFFHVAGIAQRAREVEETAWPGSQDVALGVVTWAGYSKPHDKKPTMEWVKQQWSSLQDEIECNYINAVPFDGTAPEQAQSVYRGHYDKLSELKAKYDPENMFRYNVNILPHKQEK